jgi:hypothetical protein
MNVVNEDHEKRTNKWLAERMYDIWEEHFADVPRRNLVLIKFGRSSSRQLGSIKWAGKKTRIKSLMKKSELKKYHATQDDKRITVITITKNFMNPEIPDYVVDATIAHEIVHYAHGFSSPLKQTYRFPHQGGVVRKELAERGLGTIQKKAKSWLRQHWHRYS